ncbi:MAG: hypothetical protein CBC12_07255 [Candidatus Puniceispirillum sp. TMED52]|nr:MAG: hypothetical protein CBC12_07255 [Candidatus Puniceispirillum sp. TMED52]
MSRAFVTSGIETFSDIDTQNYVVFLVTATGCEHCSRFETEHISEAEQVIEDKYRGVTLNKWICDDDTKRDIALSSGVSDVPAIVVVDHKRGVTVTDAFKFVSKR